jgi:transcriptional regulator with XRE-family HTH domain
MDNDVTRMRKYTCEKIKYYRRINNFSQADMADKLWMSKRAYHRLENGETSLTLDRIHQIAKIYGIPVTHLIGFEFEIRNTDVLKEIKSLNQQYIMNEKKIIEILRELKDRIA